MACSIGQIGEDRRPERDAERLRGFAAGRPGSGRRWRRRREQNLAADRRGG